MAQLIYLVLSIEIRYKLVQHVQFGTKNARHGMNEDMKLYE